MITLPLLFVLAVGATPTFPDALATAAGMPCVPSCAICHDGSPGSGTASLALALALKARGLAPDDDASLSLAVDALAADEVDSDSDGTADVDELAMGLDPNPDGADLCGLPTPSYGCLNTSPHSPPQLALLGLLGLLLQRRRGRVSGGRADEGSLQG